MIYENKWTTNTISQRNDYDKLSVTLCLILKRHVIWYINAETKKSRLINKQTTINIVIIFSNLRSVHLCLINFTKKNMEIDDSSDINEPIKEWIDQYTRLIWWCKRAEDNLFLPFPLSQSACMANSMFAFRSIRRVAFTSSAPASVKWEGGVSLVQGASRGIGLEFVSIMVFLWYTFENNCYYLENFDAFSHSH